MTFLRTLCIAMLGILVIAADPDVADALPLRHHAGAPGFPFKSR